MVAAWTVGTVVPNTVGMPFFDSYCSQIHSFYKDLQFDKECMEVLDEVIKSYYYYMYISEKLCIEPFKDTVLSFASAFENM